jgi:hypothetical protein
MALSDAGVSRTGNERQFIASRRPVALVSSATVYSFDGHGKRQRVSSSAPQLADSGVRTPAARGSGPITSGAHDRNDTATDTTTAKARSTAGNQAMRRRGVEWRARTLCIRREVFFDGAMLLALLILAAAPKTDAKLVGTWQLGGESFMTLNANGAGVMEGDAIKWKADGATLTITDDQGEAEQLAYKVEGDALTINLGGMPIQLTRGGGAVKKVSQKQRNDEDAAALAMAQQFLAQQQQVQQQPKGKQGAQPQPAGNDQLSRLLLSSNWCWLRYSNGNSYTQKVHFNANGTWQDFSESDIYSNNYGTVAQATGNRTNGGQWAVKGGQFYLSSPENPQLVPVPLTITRNSNGYPIITADGREYSMCN